MSYFLNHSHQSLYANPSFSAITSGIWRAQSSIIKLCGMKSPWTFGINFNFCNPIPSSFVNTHNSRCLLAYGLPVHWRITKHARPASISLNRFSQNSKLARIVCIFVLRNASSKPVGSPFRGCVTGKARDNVMIYFFMINMPFRVWLVVFGCTRLSCKCAVRCQFHIRRTNP